MSKIYAVCGRLSSGSIFSALVHAKDKKEVDQEVKKSIPVRTWVEEYLCADETLESLTPLNSSKAVSVAWNKQELLTVSFVFQNIKDKDKNNLIEDLNKLIAKYNLSTN